MDVNEAEVTEGRGRRRHSAEFKARLVEECRQPGMSVARVARDNGVNANLLHQWIGNSRARDVAVPAVPQVADAFKPVQISARSAQMTAPIVVEVQRGAATVTVNWPIEAAAECSSWLRAWLR
jgi:transposase